MKRLVLLFVAAITVMSMPTLAQSKDIAGAWVFDAAKSGTPQGPPSLTIALTAKDVTITMGTKAGQAMTFPLDGTEAVLEKGVRSKAAWNNTTLEVTSVAASKETQVLKFSRSDAWLVMEGTTPEGPKKLFFTKAPKL
jgi:hypothetical protein